MSAASRDRAPLPVPLIDRFRRFVELRIDRRFADYMEFHKWSVVDGSAFWQAVWDFDGITSATPWRQAVEGDSIIETKWFAGATMNYAQNVFRHVERAHQAGQPAIIAEDERGRVEILDWPTLQQRVAAFAHSLRKLGIQSGDRVAAYLPNRSEAVISFLACASMGAIWTICAPDMGAPAVRERFMQVEPRLLIAADSVFYAGKEISRRDLVAELRSSLPSVEALIIVHSTQSGAQIEDALDFAGLSQEGPTDEPFTPEWLPFDHPLWIVYSSGTTGKPKALVHSHGGIVLSSAVTRVHLDNRASYDPALPGERFHWYSSTGWMLWNTQVGGLLGGTTICLFDGSPSGPRDAPDWTTLWRFVVRHKITIFGASASFFTQCEKIAVDLRTVGNLTRLRTLGSTASPLPAAVQIALSKRLADAGCPNIWWFNTSGGTDICGAFCGGHRGLPETPGKLQCRQLGAAVEAWDAGGRSVIGEVGELVCTKPLPNMPLYLWGDAGGSRHQESYFGYFPGIWRQGDWLKIDDDGTCEIFGRSDATINRGGHRMGTSEIYAAVEALPEVADSLALDVRLDNGDSRLLLFVVPVSGDTISNELEADIVGSIRRSLSPRFVPDSMIAVSTIPRTLSSKKQELPIKRLFEGASLRDAIDTSIMVNPGCVPEYVRLAAAFREGR